MIYAVAAQQVVITGAADNQVVARTGAENVTAALAVNPVIAGPAQDNVRPIGANQHVITGAADVSCDGAQAIDVFLFVNLLGGEGNAIQVVIKPIVRHAGNPGVLFPERRDNRAN